MVQMEKPVTVAPSFREPLKNVSVEEGEKAIIEGRFGTNAKVLIINIDSSGANVLC